MVLVDLHLPGWVIVRIWSQSGGKKSCDAKSWRNSCLDLFSIEKKRIVAAVIEIAVTVIMSTHVYKFMGKYFLQKQGGPIGLRSTACLANLIMKLWDIA